MRNMKYYLPARKKREGLQQHAVGGHRLQIKGLTTLEGLPRLRGVQATSGPELNLLSSHEAIYIVCMCSLVGLQQTQITQHMTLRVSLPTCSIAARPVRGPAPAPARPSVRRAASLVADKLQTPAVSSPAAELLSDTDFLAELRAHATRHGLASPLLSLDEDAHEQQPAAGAPERHQAGAALLQASSLRTQRRARPRLRRRAQRARAAWTASAGAVAQGSEADAVTGAHALISREEEVELCAAIRVCSPSAWLGQALPTQLIELLGLSGGCLSRLHLPHACVSVQPCNNTSGKMAAWWHDSMCCLPRKR